MSNESKADCFYVFRSPTTWHNTATVRSGKRVIHLLVETPWLHNASHVAARHKTAAASIGTSVYSRNSSMLTTESSAALPTTRGKRAWQVAWMLLLKPQYSYYSFVIHWHGSLKVLLQSTPVSLGTKCTFGVRCQYRITVQWFLQDESEWIWQSTVLAQFM